MSAEGATGAIAANFHEGSRSEILADYFFSALGTVTPSRRSDDHGLDLYCTLTERIGQRLRVRDYYSVQVKSDEKDLRWTFNDQASVDWLIQHPTPLFLCRVSKKEGRLRVYHVTPRFAIWATGTLPSHLELIAEDALEGVAVEWQPTAGTTYSLSAPIVDVDLAALMDEQQMMRMRNVLARWISIDRDNAFHLRAGLLKFQTPCRYRVNEVPTGAYADIGPSEPDLKLLRLGTRRLADALEWLGFQLGSSGDRGLALEATLLLDTLVANYLGDDPKWYGRVPGAVSNLVIDDLNRAVGSADLVYAGLDAVRKAITEIPLVKEYLAGSGKYRDEADPTPK